VLNNLPHCNGQLILLTSESIATVEPTIECHLILPENQFPSFPEMRYLDYSSIVVEKAKKVLHSKRISFIYQRYSLNNYSGFKLARYYKVPFVLEYNGSEIWVGKNWGRKVKNEAVSSAIEALNLQGADLIVVVSHALRDEIEQRGVAPKKILVNPNGVNTEMYSPQVDGTMIRDSYDLSGKTVIGFIGTFGRWHGAEVLVDAFGLLLNKYPALRNKVALFYIGDGITMPLVRQRVKALHIGNEVTFAGMVPQAKGPEYLASCDILASPHIPNPDGTQFFGSPTKLFEYMAMGKGIVASSLGQLKDVLKHQHTAWMVRPADPVDLMTGLEVMIENPGLRKQLGDNARSQAVDQHTWKKHTQNIMDALHRHSNGY
jgi:glycosyltransferase involved in cell wall biosynthesis